MSNKKVSDMSSLTSIEPNDLFMVVDVSDTTEALTGTTKKMSKSVLRITESQITDLNKYSQTQVNTLLSNLITLTDYRGSNCSGVEADNTGRVLTLNNTSLTNSVVVFKNGLMMHQPDVTISHLSASSTITFNVKVWDADYIKVQRV
jgi:hypothetical protein